MLRVYRFLILYAGLLFVAARSVSAQPEAAPIILTLDDAVKRGIENNLALQKNFIDLSAAGYSANRVWSELFPAISGTLGASYSGNLFSGDGFASGSGGFNAGLGINLTLNAGIPYAMKNIRLAYQTKLLSYEDARNQLEIQLTKIFYALISDHENLDTLADMLNLAQLQYEKNQVAFRNGLIRELALMQSKLSLENARYNLNAARSAYTGKLNDFLVQLGLDFNTDVLLEGKIETTKVEFDTEQLIKENLPRRPDIVSRRQEIERLENSARQTAFANRAPSLRLSADWSSKNFSPFSDTLSGSATLSIPVDPWIPGTGKSQSVYNAKLAAEKAKLDLQSAENAASLQIRSLAANLNNSWDNIEIARLGLTIAERTHQLADQGFKNGTVEALTLENALQDLVDARQKLLQSELSYFNTVLDISAALNLSWKDFTQ